MGELRSKSLEIIGYADGEPIHADPAADAEALQTRDYRGTPSYIYFIQAAHGGPIKVGRSCYPKERLIELQVANPYRLVICRLIPGAKTAERELHEHFAEARIHGEWFQPTTELCLLAGARSDLGPPDYGESDRGKKKRPSGAYNGYMTDSERQWVEKLKEQRTEARKQKPYLRTGRQEASAGRKAA